jgi:hypothetical protein
MEKINSKEIFPDDDKVDHPSHYQSYVKGLNIEAIDCMRAAFGDDYVKGFCLCNALKYIYRCHSKNGNEDIKKSLWYLNKFLELGGCD